MWRNSNTDYGRVTKVGHLVGALWVLGLFALGLWMTSLDYYHPWYHRAPAVHKSLGALFLFFTLSRWLWRTMNPKPLLPLSLSRFERIAAVLLHTLFYPLMLMTALVGWLMAGAKGEAVSVFGWFSLPSLWAFNTDWAKNAHEILAWLLISFVCLHVLAALKHEFWDKKPLLARMFKW